MSDENRPKGTEETRFDQAQYDLLKKCSDKKDITEWNQWRIDNPAKDVLLYGAELNKSWLRGALLNTGQGKWNDKKYNFTGRVYLSEAHLEGANLGSAHLEGANLWAANLEGANLSQAHLEGADLFKAHLEGAYIWDAHLQGACLLSAILDGGTNLTHCHIDRNTDFRNAGLENARIDAGTKQLLKYNIRRKNWEDWYKKHTKLKWLVRPFWLLSDYGISTGRIIGLFFAAALLFATFYYIWGAVECYLLGVKNQPGIVANLFTYQHQAVRWWLVPLRTIYFSIVTMTTLGFGDMYANEQSIFGHILLMFQVLLGYVFLGALVTRFAVLFTTGGPAGEFKPMDKETKQLLAEIEKKKNK